MNMDIRFAHDNIHHENPQAFSEVDAHLRSLENKTFLYESPLLLEIPKDPGIYTVFGSYGTGKTTLLKQWIKTLIQDEINPKCIVFISAELIKNYHDLKKILQKQINFFSSSEKIYLIIDEITSIHDWKKGFKFIFNDDKFKNINCVMSSSILPFEIAEAKKNYKLFPLSLRETILLKYKQSTLSSTLLFDELNSYLLHGGYLQIINELAVNNEISLPSLKNYSNWVVQTVLHHGKHEPYLREIINSIIKNYNQPTTWNALAQELSIDHPKTIGDYLSFLEAMDIVFIQYALIEENLVGAPKKARKLMFSSPFIFHAMQNWLSINKNNYNVQIKNNLQDPTIVSKLVATSVTTQIRRYFPTYYIKAEGEIDLAYIDENRFWPIEISWSNQMRAKDLKQILKYPNGRIFTKTDRSGVIEHIRTEPLPVALWQFEKLFTA